MKKRGTMLKRIMAFAMSGMLLASNMIVLADNVGNDQTQSIIEQNEEETTEVSSIESTEENESVDESNISSEEGNQEENATVSTTETEDENTQVDEIMTETEELTTETEETTELQTEEIMLLNVEPEENIEYDESKIDVWDFGAETLDTSKYNNLLTESVLNGFYDESIEVGSEGVNITSFSEEHGLSFEDGGYTTSHKLRTMNAEVTRFDSKSYKDVDGNVYQGVLYSNKSANTKVYLSIEAEAGDIITMYVTSNKNADSVIHFQNTDKNVDQTYTYPTTETKLQKAVFYAPEDGSYKIYSATEKLVVARIYREHGELATVTGEVEAPAGVADYQLVFENKITAAKTTVEVEDGKYNANLISGYTYAVTVKNAAGYGANPNTVEVDGDMTCNIELVEKTAYAVTIVPEGTTADMLTNATFTFTNVDEKTDVYSFTGIDNITLHDGTYSIAVTNLQDLMLGKNSNLVVSGADISKTLKFVADAATEWYFNAADFTDGTYTKSSPFAGVYHGLKFSAASSHNSTYLLARPGTINVPVSGDCNVNLSVCYEYNFDFEGDESSKQDKTTGSTGQIDTYTYQYSGEAGYVTINTYEQCYITQITVTERTDYKSVITVGENGDFATINEALELVRKMDRTSNERVTISIEPGDYEEMLVLDMNNVTLENASDAPTAKLLNQGVDIDSNSVRITSYYGHGYAYYSMSDDCKWDEETLNVNKENGSYSFENPGAGTTKGSYWNATVVITGSNIEANNIIFENSFNQYISQKASEDVIVKLDSAKEGNVTRANLPVGSTKVQEKAYVERAAALAIAGGAKKTYFNGCKFIGRQDTLYGGVDNTVAFYKCAIFGATDYIFGGMNAVFAKCDLVMNTTDHKNDVAYITAAQQKNADDRGYYMYNCHITSAKPGVETASTEVSKPGFFGRPWQKDTSEVIFYKTIIDVANDGTSLVTPSGWSAGLGGESQRVYEYGTKELAADVDNQSARVAWAQTLTEENEVIAPDFVSFLGGWDAFAGESDMDISMDIPTEDEPVIVPLPDDFSFDVADVNATGVINKSLIADGTTFVDGHFEIDGTVRHRTKKNATLAFELEKKELGSIDFTLEAVANVTLELSSTGTLNTSAVALVDEEGNIMTNVEGTDTVSGQNRVTFTYEELEPGEYSVVASNNALYKRAARFYSASVAYVQPSVTPEEPIVPEEPVVTPDGPTVTPSAPEAGLSSGTSSSDKKHHSNNSSTTTTTTSTSIIVDEEVALTGEAVDTTVEEQTDETIVEENVVVASNAENAEVEKDGTQQATSENSDEITTEEFSEQLVEETTEENITEETTNAVEMETETETSETQTEKKGNAAAKAAAAGCVVVGLGGAYMFIRKRK